MTLNGVSFNPEAVVKFATAQEFYMHASHQHYWGTLPEAERHKRLEVVWGVCKLQLEPGNYSSSQYGNYPALLDGNALPLPHDEPLTIRPDTKPAKAKRAGGNTRKPNRHKKRGDTGTEGADV